MNKSIETVKKLRSTLIRFTGELNNEQLNKVPANFNNNIIWNMAHIISAQQGLCYVRCGLKTVVDEPFFLAYRPGTKPEGIVDNKEVELIKTLLLSTIDKLETDYDENIFTNYPTFTTHYGVELTSIEDAINFLSFHDGFHMGYILALKRAVLQ